VKAWHGVPIESRVGTISRFLEKKVVRFYFLGFYILKDFFTGFKVVYVSSFCEEG